MVSVEVQATVLAREGLRAKAAPGYWQGVWGRLWRDPVSMSALIVLGLLVLLALGAPLVSALVTHAEPNETKFLLENYDGPSAKHWFGVDENGRDYLTRIVWAGRVSLQIGLLIALFAMLIGVPLGLIAAFFGGWIDDVINAVINTIQSIPGIFLLILIASLVQPDVVGLAFIVAALGWTGNARLVRGTALSVRERDYVQAARALGARNYRIMAQHILPNILSIVIVAAAFDVAGGILAESSLSFLGLGIHPPTASWGNMLINSQSYVNKQPWLLVFPGLFIFTTVLCVFLLGDGLRDALDPRLRHRRS